MPSPTWADGLMLALMDDRPVTAEPFDLGVVAKTAVEPFDMEGPKVTVTSVEPFWMMGAATKTAVEPFDLGEKIAKTAVEPFDMLTAGDQLLDPVDLGDGELVAADAAPIYGYWVPDETALEDLGTVNVD